MSRSAVLTSTMKSARAVVLSVVLRLVTVVRGEMIFLPQIPFSKNLSRYWNDRNISRATEYFYLTWSLKKEITMFTLQTQ